MLAQFYVHLIFFFITTPIPLIFGECITDADKCFDDFKSDLENQMKQQFDSAETQLSQICHPIDGSFNKFVNCINEVKTDCHLDQRFRTHLCDKRYLKTKIYKFTWKASFFYQLCYNSTPELSQGFLQHEDCINTVFLTRKWKCDYNYERVVKSKRDWKTDLNTTCSLWQKFRDCSKRDINQRCGTDASLISDHLFHSHQSYFEKYYSCDFNSSKFSDQCWYDLTRAKATDIHTSISLTTQSTDDMTDNNIDTNKSSHLMTINDNTIQTQSSDINSNIETLEDTTNSENENSDKIRRQSLFDQTRIDQNQSVNHDSEGQESNQTITTDVPLNVNAMKESNGTTIGQLTANSGATTDSIADKYLLTIPIIIMIFIKFFI